MKKRYRNQLLDIERYLQSDPRGSTSFANSSVEEIMEAFPALGRLLSREVPLEASALRKMRRQRDHETADGRPPSNP